MTELEVTCGRCKMRVVHECYCKHLEDAALALFRWRPEMGFPEQLRKKNDLYDKGVEDPEVPFLSETYLYALLGKEDARTLLAYVDALFYGAGLDPHAFKTKAWAMAVAKKEGRLAAEAHRAEAKRQWEIEMKPAATEPEDDFTRASYASFYAFDTNVNHCEEGRCLATREERTKSVKPSVGPLATQYGGLVLSCLQCKRRHTATKEQVEGWREEKHYKTEKYKPEDFLRADCLQEHLSPSKGKKGKGA